MANEAFQAVLDRLDALEDAAREANRTTDLPEPDVIGIDDDTLDRSDYGSIIIDRKSEVTYKSVLITDTYTALRNDRTIYANPGEAKTITLPDSDKGKQYTVKNLSAFTITVDGGSYNIDGAATNDLTAQYDWITVEMGDSEWSIVSRT